VCEQLERRGVVLVGAGFSEGIMSVPATLPTVLGVTPVRDRIATRLLQYRPGAAYDCAAMSNPPGAAWMSPAGLVSEGGSFAAAVVSGLTARLLERAPTRSLTAVRRALSAWAA
jgi:hypothetical protein